MINKIAVRIDNEEDLEKFSCICESEGWESSLYIYRGFNPIEYPIYFNLSSTPSLSWDYIDFYVKNGFDIISIQEALNMFNMWIPKKGETVLAKFKHEWEPVVFIAEYDGRYVCKDNMNVCFFDEIKEYPKHHNVVLCVDYETESQKFQTSLTEEQVQQTIDFMKGLKENDQ